jgi:hypothetical protein
MKVLSAVVLFCGVMSVFASAQTVGASLQGTIHDPSGAVLPRTQVEIRNVRLRRDAAAGFPSVRRDV